MPQPPPYHELPEVLPGYPCSWTYFNDLLPASGEKDELGTVSFVVFHA